VFVKVEKNAGASAGQQNPRGELHQNSSMPCEQAALA